MLCLRHSYFTLLQDRHDLTLAELAISHRPLLAQIAFSSVTLSTSQASLRVAKGELCDPDD